MEFRDDILFAKVFESSLLLDGYIKKIEISTDDNNQVKIFIKIEISNKDFAFLDLHLSRLTQYHFYYTNDIHFYLIDRFKLLKFTDYYYLALNPSNDDQVIDDDDEDVIYFSNMKGILS